METPKIKTVKELIREETHLIQMTPNPDSDPWAILAAEDVKKICASLHTSLVAAVEQLDAEVQPSNFEEDNFDAGEHYAFSKVLTIINSIFKE